MISSIVRPDAIVEQVVAGSVEPSDFPADELIAGLGKDKITGLVGKFPFVKRLGKKVGTLHLFELRRVPGAVPDDQWGKKDLLNN